MSSILKPEERAYFQRRLREEIARCARFHDVFSLVLLEATPRPGSPPNRRSTLTAAALLAHRLRASDVVAAIHDDTIALLLTGTGVAGLRDVEQRVRRTLAIDGNSWRLREFCFPEQSSAIAELDLLSAA